MSQKYLNINKQITDLISKENFSLEKQNEYNEVKKFLNILNYSEYKKLIKELFSPSFQNTEWSNFKDIIIKENIRSSKKSIEEIKEEISNANRDLLNGLEDKTSDDTEYKKFLGIIQGIDNSKEVNLVLKKLESELNKYKDIYNKFRNKKNNENKLKQIRKKIQRILNSFFSIIVVEEKNVIINKLNERIKHIYNKNTNENERIKHIYNKNTKRFKDLIQIMKQDLELSHLLFKKLYYFEKELKIILVDLISIEMKEQGIQDENWDSFLCNQINKIDNDKIKKRARDILKGLIGVTDEDPQKLRNKKNILNKLKMKKYKDFLDFNYIWNVIHKLSFGQLKDLLTFILIISIFTETTENTQTIFSKLTYIQYFANFYKFLLTKNKENKENILLSSINKINNFLNFLVKMRNAISHNNSLLYSIHQERISWIVDKVIENFKKWPNNELALIITSFSKKNKNLNQMNNYLFFNLKINLMITARVSEKEKVKNISYEENIYKYFEEIEKLIFI